MQLGVDVRNKTSSCRSKFSRQRELRVHTHAQTKSHFCLSLLFVIMKHQKITQGRLVDGGESAARAVFADVCAVLDLSQTERSCTATKHTL